MEDWKFHNMYSGTPQGGIISPIPANIYLDKFDKYMNEYTQTFDKGKCRCRSLEHRSRETKKSSLQRNFKVKTDENIRKQLTEEIRAIEKGWVKIPCGDAMDKNRKRLKYVRYVGDFLVGVIGSKAGCTQIKADITQYMSENLKPELSAEKTLITQAQKSAKFLGYEIFIRKSNAKKTEH